LTPTTFWCGLGTYLCAVEYSGHGYAGFLTATIPFLWAHFCDPGVPTAKQDPLNAMMDMLTGLLSVGAAASYYGYGPYFIGASSALWFMGYSFAPGRKFRTGEEVTKDCDLCGKIVYITGPTSGIGTETARVLCLRGAHVILASRNENKLENTKLEIERKIPGAKLSTVQVDLGDQESVKQSIKKLEQMNIQKIDILINNAGIMASPTRKSTAQGLDMQMGVNHVGHFLLTKLLTPFLKNAAPSRVVCLSSIAHYYHDDKFYNHPQLECEPYHKWVAYGNSKMANQMFAREYNRRYKDDGISAFSLNPGGIFTGLQGDVEPTKMFKWIVIAPFFFKTIAQGSSTTLYCATTPGLEKDGGEYFDNCKLGRKERMKRAGEEQSKKLWEATEKLLC